MIKEIKKFIKINNLDGYIIPKNDHYFTEYSKINNLARLTKFTGSAGFALILKKKNYLFVDGRYTIQAEIESGKEFEVTNLTKIENCKLFKNLTLGLDPKLFTSKQTNNFFLKYNKVKEIQLNLIDSIYSKYQSKSKPFFSLSKKTVGESHLITVSYTHLTLPTTPYV